MIRPDLSIIIPAHNEAAYLGPTLTAAHAAATQLGVRYELIVVDDASTDQTASVAAAGGARVIQVRHRQIGASRNSGAAAAQGDVFVFLDADTILPAATLAAAWDQLRHVAGGGALVQFSNRVSLMPRLLLATWNLYSRCFNYAAGCFVFTHRQAFEAAGGFDERLFAAEELVLSKALRQQGRFVILNHTVVTSDRKVRDGWFQRHAALALRLIMTAGRGVRRREDLDLWYDPGR
jgi:glycosyltransferase involved in cell wall biosynthesis